MYSPIFPSFLHLLVLSLPLTFPSSFPSSPSSFAHPHSSSFPHPRSPTHLIPPSSFRALGPVCRQVTHMLRRYTRDICAIQSYRKDGANHLITLRSVVWPECPEAEKEAAAERPRRITLLPSGWVIEPITRVVDSERWLSSLLRLLVWLWLW